MGRSLSLSLFSVLLTPGLRLALSRLLTDMFEIPNWNLNETNSARTLTTLPSEEENPLTSSQEENHGGIG